MTYPTKIDWWVALVLIVVSLVELGIGGILVYEAVIQAAPLPLLLQGIFFFLLAGLLLWIYASTGYDISPPHLVCRSGPIRFTVPLDAIVEVQNRTRYSAELAWNFGLSVDRLYIRYRKPSGRTALLGVVVSPKDKQGFLQELCRELKGLPNESVVDDRL